MSVKLMSSEALRNDLATIAMTWPDGVPWEQVDRINALKAELKRRGEPLEKPADPVADRADLRPTMDQMTTEELEGELRKLSASISRNPDDGPAQQRFADVRFELRRRTKSAPAEVAPGRPTPRARALEFTSDVERGEVAGRMTDPELAGELRLASARRGREREEVRGRLGLASLETVRGFSATPHPDGSVTVTFENDDDGLALVVARTMTVKDLDALVAAIRRARDEASKIIG